MRGWLTTSARNRELCHVYWIGGASAAGKSTIARRLAARHGFGVYATDDVMADHTQQSTAQEAPFLARFLAMDMDERWVSRSPEEMLDTFPWFRGEGFEQIVDDMRRLPAEPAVIAEGFRLLPHLVQPLLPTPRRAVWLLPTPAFRQTVFESRGGSSWGFLARTSDPELALGRLLERDRMFTERLREEAKGLDLPTVEIDATTTEADVLARVTEGFGL